MPKPIKDYALLFRKEIETIDAKIAKLQADRAKLVHAYVLLTGNFDLGETGAAVDWHKPA